MSTPTAKELLIEAGRAIGPGPVDGDPTAYWSDGEDDVEHYLAQRLADVLAEVERLRADKWKRTGGEIYREAEAVLRRRAEVAEAEVERHRLSHQEHGDCYVCGLEKEVERLREEAEQAHEAGVRDAYGLHAYGLRPVLQKMPPHESVDFAGASSGSGELEELRQRAEEKAMTKFDEAGNIKRSTSDKRPLLERLRTCFYDEAQEAANEIERLRTELRQRVEAAEAELERWKEAWHAENRLRMGAEAELWALHPRESRSAAAKGK